MAAPLIRDGREVLFLRILSLFIFSGTDFALFSHYFRTFASGFQKPLIYRASVGDVSGMYR